MGIIEKLKDTIKEHSREELKEIEYDIASAFYFQKDIEKVVSKLLPINNRYIMESFDDKSFVVWKYNPCKIKNVKFEKEPKNKHDKNAIKIMVGISSIDYRMIGYIPKEENVKFAKLLDEKKIYNVNLTILGGERKTITENCVVNGEDSYKVILRVIIKN